MTTRSVEDKVESLFLAIQELVQIEAARAVWGADRFEDLPYFDVEDIDDESLEKAELNLKRQLLKSFRKVLQ